LDRVSKLRKRKRLKFGLEKVVIEVYIDIRSLFVIVYLSRCLGGFRDGIEG
jgi:hypothetical protein